VLSVIECKGCGERFEDRPAYVVHRAQGGDAGKGEELCRSPLTYRSLLVQVDAGSGVFCWRVSDRWKQLRELAQEVGA